MVDVKSLTSFTGTALYVSLVVTSLKYKIHRSAHQNGFLTCSTARRRHPDSWELRGQSRDGGAVGESLATGRLEPFRRCLVYHYHYT